MEEVKATMLAHEAGMSRATFYRAYPSVEALLEACYARFSERVTRRLAAFLSDEEQSAEWLSGIVNAVVDDAARTRHVLVAMFREELRPGATARGSRHQRLETQVDMLGEWWVRSTGTASDRSVIYTLALLLQIVGVHVALHPEFLPSQRDDLKRASSFVIRATIDAYRSASPASATSGTKSAKAAKAAKAAESAQAK